MIVDERLIYKVKRKYATSPQYEVERDKFEEINYLSPIQYRNNSRYTALRTYIDKVAGVKIHETWMQKVLSESSQDEYYTVTNAEENRLDLVSYYYYYTGKYWWVVALANYLLDPFDVPVGTNLRVPPISVLYEEGGILNG